MSKKTPLMVQDNEDSPRQRILAATEQLIAEAGVDAATTRAVAAAAGVQAPTLYRLFGDKDGLLDAVAEHAMAAYVADKARRPALADPVEDLRAGWDAHVTFALTHPGIFRIMVARPSPRREAAAMHRAVEVLRQKIRALASAGRLQMAEQRALDLFQGAATGVILTLLGQETPDLALSKIARETALAALTGTKPPNTAGEAGTIAMALRVRLDELNSLSAGERLLLSELLDRIAGG